MRTIVAGTECGNFVRSFLKTAQHSTKHVMMGHFERIESEN